MTIQTQPAEAETVHLRQPLAGTERMVGSDAFHLHMERPDTPMHTLKVVVLDSSRADGPLTLADLERVLPRYLGLVRRASQRVQPVPGFGAKPFWVDVDVRVADHLDERWVEAPGDRAAFDRVCSDLAVEQLDRSRPLWAMTLVHGLEGGRQAVVVRVHHAVMDGLAALNTFVAATSDEPGRVLPEVLPPPAAAVDPVAMRRHASSGLLTGVRRTAHAVRSFAAEQRATREFGDVSQIPSGLVRRTSLNRPSGHVRSCVSTHLDLADLKTLAKATGVTLNGALHAVVAAAMREELLARGESPDAPLVALFAVAEDTSSDRRWGNRIASARAYLRTDLDDPLDLLHETARSCLLTVDLRRRRGFDLTQRTHDLLGRLGPSLRAGVAHVIPRVSNHITTANVRGPATTRWIGDHEVVDWISFSLAVAPADLNLTGYSYDGQFRVGFVSTPESMPEPREFVQRLHRALDHLLAVAQGTPGAGADRAPHEGTTR
jgi:WS/DGAT/MGAT family acyltransferase